jgi:hypothetical protein
VDLTSVDPAANNTIVYAVQDQLKQSPMFDPKAMVPSPTFTPDPTTGTFTFTITVVPAIPLKL